MHRFALSALALAAASPAAAQTPPPAPPPPPSGTMLEIVAEGISKRTPDIAVIQAGVVTQAATATAAIAENGARMARVVAALKAANVRDLDVQTATISLSPQYAYADGKPPELTGYQATNRLTVRFREVARSGAILDALVAQGANSIDGPTLEVSAADAALDEARADAVAKARARAELYARAAGLRVARMLSISEAGPVAPGFPIMASARSAAMDVSTQILPGESSLTATVTVRFLLD